MNWNNINLESPYELQQPILDPYTSETLLLEVECNCKEINHQTVREQAMGELNLKFKTAVEILDANLDNLVKKATQTRSVK